MATTIAFNPPPNQGFSFQATLDGLPYTVVIAWNLFGRRWWFQIYDANNDLVATAPATSSSGSPTPINLIAAWFQTSTLYYYDQSQQFVVGP